MSQIIPRVNMMSGVGNFWRINESTSTPSRITHTTLRNFMGNICHLSNARKTTIADMGQVNKKTYPQPESLSSPRQRSSAAMIPKFAPRISEPKI